jgi:hypothetical protein
MNMKNTLTDDLILAKLASYEAELKALFGDGEASIQINFNSNGDSHFSYSSSTPNGIRRSQAISIPAAAKTAGQALIEPK